MASPIIVPKITLDTTLAELYSSEDKISPAPAHLNAFPCSDCAMTNKIPQNRRYLYQDSELSKPWTPAERQGLRRILAIKLLNVLAQRYSFVCGGLEVIMFDPENPINGITSSDYAKTEAEKTLSALAEHQRPRMHMVAGSSTATLPPNVSRMAAAMPFDGMDHIPHLLHPDRHYKLLSKGCLATSRLPTPRAEVLPFEATEELLAITDKHPGFFPNDVALLNLAEQRIFESCVTTAVKMLIKKMVARDIPFVVKSQQSSSGGGTYLIRNENERASCIEKMRTMALPVLVSSINSSNKHLSPADFIITDYVHAVRSSGVSFFVTQSGQYHFLSACRQDFDKEGFWAGGYIDYEIQERERKRFDDTICQVARFVHGRGFYGPIGIDVLENAEDHQFVVDMNVRVPGSLPLGLLRRFFYRERGLRHGYIVLGIRFPMSREDFLQRFRLQVTAGQIVIVAWYEDRAQAGCVVSWTNLAMARETVDGLTTLRQLILGYSLKTKD